MGPQSRGCIRRSWPSWSHLQEPRASMSSWTACPACSRLQTVTRGMRAQGDGPSRLSFPFPGSAYKAGKLLHGRGSVSEKAAPPGALLPASWLPPLHLHRRLVPIPRAWFWTRGDCALSRGQLAISDVFYCHSVCGWGVVTPGFWHLPSAQTSPLPPERIIWPQT